MAGLTEAISDFIVNQSLESVPNAGLNKAKKAIADTVGVMLAGSVSEVAAPLARYIEHEHCIGQARILGANRSVSPEIAALVNGTFGHALDFDDVLTMMPGHPSAVIVAALFAELGGKAVSGASFLEAYIMGIEVGGKLGLAMTIGHHERGFHSSATLGTFAAVGALCKSRRVDIATTRAAFGIAASMVGGVHANFGTMTKPLHSGLAAKHALLAVNLAALGFSSNLAALEAPGGFVAVYGVQESDPKKTIKHLGRPWVIVDPGLGLKKFACTYAAHRGMDAILQLMSKHAFKADDVVLLECLMPPGGMRTLIYPIPCNGLESKFSMEYALASGVLDGHYSLTTFSDSQVDRPQIQEMLRKIRVREDQSCAGNDPMMKTQSPGSRGFVKVSIQLKSGLRDTVRVDTPPGHPLRELSWLDIENKFNDCASTSNVALKDAAGVLDMLRRLEALDDMNKLIGSVSCGA